MSKVPTLVLATDGQFYEDPVLRGDKDGAKWFICFDDDDPPELVIQTNGRSMTENHAIAILSELGFAFKLHRERPTMSIRYFGKNNTLFAAAFDFDIDSPIPVPQDYDYAMHLTSFKDIVREARYYDFGTLRRESR